METTLSLPEIKFPSKNDLYKNEFLPDIIEEKMLLHIDNELDRSSAGQLEKEIQGNSGLRREWNILQGTKLDPADTVIFENKKILYRQEKGKVISIAFRRVAAAAAIAGVGIFVGLSLFKGNRDLQSFAVAEVTVKPVEQGTEPGVAVLVKENLVDGQSAVAIKPGKPETGIEPQMKITTAEVKEKVTAIDNNPQKQFAATGIPKSKTSLEKINSLISNEMVSSPVNDKKLERNKVLVNTAPEGLRVVSPVLASMTPLEDKEITGNPNSYAQAAISEEAVSESGNHILFIKEERLDRSKASGLFRQVKRVLSRNANVKAGTTVKIAGFEIAAR